MGGFDDHVGIMGDWMAPSPSPRTFFSAMLGDDASSRPISAEENQNRPLFNQSDERITLTNLDSENGPRTGIACDQNPGVGRFSEPKMSSNGGLLERMAARAGFHAPRLNTESIRPNGLSQNQEIRSPYLTIPPGLSPTTLLDSPVFLSNSQVQPSPTTGKFQFSKSKLDMFDDIGSSSFAFKPVAESGSSFFLGAPNKPFPSMDDASIKSETSLLPPTVETAITDLDKNNGCNDITSDHSPPLDDQQDDDDDEDQRVVVDPTNLNGSSSEDGYNWRKYGQKQVKGSEFPRSYYKCTHPNCPVKKKVERSREGHITEIIYKGAHSHPKPLPNRRSTPGSSSNALCDMQQQIDGGGDWKNDNLEANSVLAPEFGNASQFEPGEPVDVSSTFSNEEEEDDRATHGSVGYDGEEDESESKRRKIEAYATEMSGATRAIREPRVVVQTTSEVDILDDGYRWRKYGQKVVKGNPNPRSYYKCTSAGCTVRKHVERASHDLKSVITTYEGKHNHDVPAARNSSHLNSSSVSVPTQSVSVPTSVSVFQSQIHRPGQSQSQQMHNIMARFERPSFGRQHFGPPNGFGFGLNQQMGFANMGMAGLGPNPYMGPPRPMNEMGLPKMEPMSEPGLNLSNGSSVYQQMMSRLPLGNQMQ